MWAGKKPPCTYVTEFCGADPGCQHEIFIGLVRACSFPQAQTRSKVLVEQDRSGVRRTTAKLRRQPQGPNLRRTTPACLLCGPGRPGREGQASAARQGAQPGGEAQAGGAQAAAQPSRDSQAREHPTIQTCVGQGGRQAGGPASGRGGPGRGGGQARKPRQGPSQAVLSEKLGGAQARLGQGRGPRRGQRGGPGRGARPGGRPGQEGGTLWLACLSHAPAPEPVLGLLRCACRASSEPASLTLRHARCCYSQRPQLAPVYGFLLGFRV